MQPQEVNADGSGNSYIDVYNVRVSLVEKTDQGKDWEGARCYLRFSAYTGQGRGVMRGPELPLNDDNVLNILRAIVAMAERGAQRERAAAA